MSTILRALKRAEQDCPAQNSENSRSSALTVRATVHSRMKRKARGGKRKVTLLVALVCLGIVMAGGGGLFFFLNTSDQTVLPSGNRISQPVVSMPAQPNDHTSRIREPDKRAADSPEAVQPPALAPERLRTPSLEKIIPEGNPKITQPDTGNMLIRQQDKLETKRLPPQSADVMETSTETPDETVLKPGSQTKMMDDRPTPDTLIITDGRLKIQAISWAETPVERVVVINNKVLGEGESIEGYRVVGIEKDQVLLLSSGQMYLLRFQYR